MSNHETWSRERLAQLKTRWKRGESPDALASLFCCHRQTIYIRVWRYGYCRTGGWEWTEPRRAKLKAMVKRRASRADIQKALGASKHTVAKEMRRLGLRLRKPSQRVGKLNWIRARAAYEYGENVEAVCREYGIARPDTLYKKASKEGWVRACDIHKAWEPTSEQVTWLKNVWYSPISLADICKKLGVSYATLNRVIRRHSISLPPRASKAVTAIRFSERMRRARSHGREVNGQGNTSPRLLTRTRKRPLAGSKQAHPLQQFANRHWSLSRIIELKTRWEAGELPCDLSWDWGLATSTIYKKVRQCGFKRVDGCKLPQQAAMERRKRRILFLRSHGMGPTDIAESMGLKVRVVGYIITKAIRSGEVQRLGWRATGEQIAFIKVCYGFGITVETIRRMVGAPSVESIYGLKGVRRAVRHRNARRKLQMLCAPDRLLAYDRSGGDTQDLLMRVYRRMRLDRKSEIIEIWRNYNNAVMAIPNLFASSQRADDGMMILSAEPVRAPFTWRKRRSKKHTRIPAKPGHRAGFFLLGE